MRVNKNGQKQGRETSLQDKTTGKKGYTIKHAVGTTNDQLRYMEATRNARNIE